MEFKNENRHMVDVLFVITLFFVFALSALTLVILGANVYKQTVDNMDQSFNQRTAYAYITQKIRQYDESDLIHVAKLKNTDALVMTEEVNDTIYSNYIYEYDGYLCELLTRADMDMYPEDGNQIIALDSFSVSQVDGNLYEFKMQPSGGEMMNIYISTHSQSGGQINE